MGKSVLIGSLQEALKKFSDNVAMQTKKDSGWDTITYAELKNSIDKASSFIKAQGIKRGDRIALLLENRPEWGIIFFTCISTGVIVVPLDIHSPSNDVKNIINDSKAKAIFISEESGPLIEELKDFPAVEKIIVVDGKRTDAKIVTFPQLSSLDLKETPPSDLPQSEDLAVILYTSGTTATPKGVMLTHQNLCSNFNSISKVNIISSKDNLLSILPLYHAYSLMVTLILPILSGARVIYPAADWPDTLASYVKDTGVTMLVGVPQMFNMLHRRITNKLQGLGLLPKLFINTCINFSWMVRKRYGLNLAKILLSKLHNVFGMQLRFFATGGAKIDKKVEEDFFRWGFTILEGYGLTETSPVATFNPPQKPKIGSVGKPIPDVKIRIVNEDEEGVGEVAIRGPNVMKGYYNKEEQTKECIKDGWFFSGDLGCFDKEGYLYLTGRSKELIVLSSGKNIYPEEVEKEYSSTPFVKELCILGVAKEAKAKTQDYLYAVVVPDLEFFKKRGEVNIYDVIKNRFEDISKGLPSHQHIMGFMIIKELLPRTVLGKIKRYEVERRHLADILKRRRTPQEEVISPEEEKILSSEVGKKVVAYLRKSLNIKEKISPHSSIEIDLGVDSLGRAELMSAMESSFAIKLPDSMVAASIFTVKDLILKIENSLVIKMEEGLAPSAIEPIYIRELIKRPLGAEFMEKIQLEPSLFDKLLTFLVRGLVYLFFKIFYRLKVEGAQKVPKEGPYIICVNHVSFFDGFIVAASVPFHSAIKLFFMGFRRYFVVPVIRSLVKKGRILPIDATQIVDAMQAAYFVLGRMKALCIFPEGERSFNGKVQRFKKGVGIVAKEIGPKLVPAFIEGAFEAWPRTRGLPRLGRIRIRFGEPADSQQLIVQGRRLGKEDDAEAIASAVRERVIALKEGH